MANRDDIAALQTTLAAFYSEMSAAVTAQNWPLLIALKEQCDSLLKDAFRDRSFTPELFAVAGEAVRRFEEITDQIAATRDSLMARLGADMRIRKAYGAPQRHG